MRLKNCQIDYKPCSLTYSLNTISELGEALATTVQGTQEDVDLAVAAAKKAYTSWSQTPGHVRARILYRWVELPVHTWWTMGKATDTCTVVPVI